MSSSVLIIDDDPEFGLDLEAILSPEFACRYCASGEEGLGALAGSPTDVVILDLMLGAGRGGLEILDEIRRRYRGLPVIMATAHPSAETEAEALRRGALYYVRKSAGRGEIRAKLAKCLEVLQASSERDRLQREIGSLHGTFLGASSRMRQLLTTMDRAAAASRSTVLIVGESGTGKSHLAFEIHRRSARSAEPFLRINPSTLGEDVLRSELFGHVKGAFTGAVSDRKGHFETAGEGTIFLDEIGDMPLSLQGHLLHAIEEREVMPVGSSQARPVRARVIAATNCDLAERVSDGRFRPDLYGRLAVLLVEVPPLRDHPDDIPDLAHYFLGRMAADMHLRHLSISDDALRKLSSYSWKRNNVRELRNVIERALVFHGQEEMLTGRAFDLPADLDPPTLDYKTEKARVVRAFQREFFARVFDAVGGLVDHARPDDITKVAEVAGLPPYTVRRILKELE